MVRETGVTGRRGRIIDVRGSSARHEARTIPERRMLETRRPRHCRHCWSDCGGNCLLPDGTCIHGYNGNRPPIALRALLTRRWWNRVLWGEYGKR